MSEFYDCKGLLETLDKNGDVPELYIVCSRVRGPGKTFSFCRHMVETFEKTGDKFVLLARTANEVGNVADGMMKSMLDTLYDGWSVMEKSHMGGAYSDIYLLKGFGDDGEADKVHCGYVIAINAADKIKKISSKFSDSVHAYFDEFQPDNMETYLTNEVDKFLTVHGSIARGQGQSRRHYPVYMSSNTINIANPYFVELGLTNKLQPETKKYRGDRFVFQRATNEGLVEVHKSSGMSQAFSSNKTLKYGDNSWINDNNAGVGKPSNWGRSVYACTLDKNGKRFGLHVYPDYNIVYLSHSYDPSHNGLYRLEVDGASNMPLLSKSDAGITIKRAITSGNMRFQDQVCKRLAMEFLV